MTCTTCEHADEHGWFGTNNPHCRTCHRDWRGTAQMHCATCCNHFTSVSACNRHETPHGCADPATLRHGPRSATPGEPVFQQVDRFGGPAWALTGTNPHTLDYKAANP